MILTVGTFNLFQFCNPNFSFYTKKDKFSSIDWEEKKLWIKEQILKMGCDIIGFQEVFSSEDLKNLLQACGFLYFEVVDYPKIDSKNEKVFISTTVAIASKFPIISIEKVQKKDGFIFSREPIKAKIQLKDKKEIYFYVTHLKSNRLNEFEYIFTQNDTLEDKKRKVELSLKNNYSLSLKQRINEAKNLFFDIKSLKAPAILVCDLNDKEFSITIDALTNYKFYNINLKNNSYLLFDAYNLYKPKIYNPHPEFKGIKRVPTSYFVGKGNVLDYIFVSKELKKIVSYKVFDEHLQKNQNGTLKQSDHAQVVCEIEI
ncbi:endonuclease/exonuclease/phosphatase family protein [Aliarcobacter lanthieri]|uniref:endonuclease/exonuclease/phosphatase family protein n=1 Tax=Aliarcobacter lanthieri TaxID=1355374 RepID=UPI003AA8DB2A